MTEKRAPIFSEETRRAVARVLDSLNMAPAPPEALRHTCCRCEHTAAVAERRGFPIPPVNDVESWVGESGVVYVASLCRGCADLEASLRWDLRLDQALTENAKLQVRRRIDAWTRTGHRYVGSKYPGAPAPGPHVLTCRCEKCRPPQAAQPGIFDDMLGKEAS
jgi:hypothetical protein